MDTISSRESNTNFLPLVGIAVGAFALIFAIVALVKLSSVNREINDFKSNINAQVDSVNSQVGQIAQINQAVNDAKAYAGSIAKGTNDGFAKVSDELNQIKARLDKVEAARVAPVRAPATGGAAAAATGATGAAAAAAGANVYVVKSGDTGVTIARANGVSLAALQAANPDVQWNRLHVGQKIKLPARAQ